jgi:hypothetical protein
VAAERPVAPARPRPRPADDEDDRDWEERRPRRPRQQQGGSNALMIALLVGGGVLMLVVLGCTGIGFLVYFLSARPSVNGPVAVSRAAAPNNNPAPPPPQANNPAPPPPADNPPPDQGGGQAPNAPFPGGIPQPPGMPGGIPQPPVPPGFPGGMQPGNQESSVVLSNPRVSRLGARLEIWVDYKWVKGGPAIGQHVFVLIKSSRSTSGAEYFGPEVRQEGTFHMRGISFRRVDRGPYEIYLETGLPGPFGQRHRISNTVTAN